MASLARSTSVAVFNYKADDSRCHTMLVAMGKMRDADMYTDIKLLLDDNSIISAHRVVLASFSKYFEGLLSPNMQEGNQHEPVKLHDVDKESLMALVDFAYTSEIAITMQNVQSLVETANYLGIVSVIEACCHFLKTEMDNGNCLPILALADGFDLVDLRDTAMKYTLLRYNDIRQQEEFTQLPCNLLSSMLQQESIVVSKSNVIATSAEQEYVILQSVFDYVSKNKSISNDEILVLFSNIRFGVISPERLQELQSQYKEVLDANQGLKRLIQGERTEKDNCPREFPKKDRYGSSMLASGGNVRPVVSRFNHCDTEQLTGLGPDDYICGMDLSIRRWDGRPVLGGLTVYYSNGYKTSHGNLQANEFHSFKLNSDERIVKVDAYSGWMIDQLTFTTNSGREIGPFGGPGGGQRQCTPDPDQCPVLSRIEGAVVDNQESLGITHLKFYFTVYQLSREHKTPENKASSIDSRPRAIARGRHGRFVVPR